MRNGSATTAAHTLTISRLVLLVVMALLVGTMLAQGADAKTRTPKLPSVERRVQGQRDLCGIAGKGKMSTTTTPFGATITDCKGGTEDGTHCVNTKNSTNCTKPRTQPLPVTGGMAPPSNAGIEDEPATPGRWPTASPGVLSGRVADDHGPPPPPTVAPTDVAPVTDPVVEPAADPVVAPVAEPIAEPVVQPVAEPVVEPVVAPAGDEGVVAIDDEQP